jgi:hypothetical protein
MRIASSHAVQFVQLLPSRVMGWEIFALRELEAHLFRDLRYSIPK